jgi:hypothetical protein
MLSKWTLRAGSALAVVGFAFLLSGIWSGLTQRYTQLPYDRAKMLGAIAFAILVVGWILRRRKL